jgi:hypothetical protein
LVTPVGLAVTLVGRLVTPARRSAPDDLAGLSGAQPKATLVVDVFPVRQALPLVGLIACDRRGRCYLGVDFLLIFAHFGSSSTRQGLTEQTGLLGRSWLPTCQRPTRQRERAGLRR